MSTTTVDHASEPRLHRLCRIGQRSLPWLISVFFHLGVIVLLSFFVIVVSRPRPKLPIGPIPVVGGMFTPQQDQLRVERDKPKLKTAQSFRDPAPAWTKVDMQDVHASENDSDWATGKQVDLVDGTGTDGTPDWTPGPDGKKDLTGTEGGKLTRVVYLLDASGSMLDSLDSLKRRLYAELGHLGYGRVVDGAGNVAERKQYFNIVFFRTKCEPCWPALRPATTANKLTAARWAQSVIARGQTDPIAALRTAFGYDPEQIVMLSDGEFDPEVLKVVERLQRSRRSRVRIITIAYGNVPSDNNLRKLAADNGGHFRRISDE